MHLDQATVELSNARLALLVTKQQLANIYRSLRGRFDPLTDKPLDLEGEIKAVAGLACDELKSVLKSLDAASGLEETEVIELDEAPFQEQASSAFRSQDSGADGEEKDV